MAISILHWMIPESKDYRPAECISMIFSNIFDRSWAQSEFLSNNIIRPLIRPTKDHSSVAVLDQQDEYKHHDDGALRCLNNNIFCCGIVSRVGLHEMSNVEEPCNSYKSPVVPSEFRNVNFFLKVSFNDPVRDLLI